MRGVFFILVLSLAWAAPGALAWAEPKILSRDGSLVIENPDSKKVKKDGGPEDTLYELLGQEVQVYIFNNKTRVWPRLYGRSSPTLWKGQLKPKDPWIEDLIRKYAQIYGVDPSLVRAVMRHESGFNPGAVSPKGAQGLMQLMPGTAALMGVSNPFDPEQNIAGGVGYLRRCLDRFQHNVPLAVAAYNAGPERVAQCGTIPPIDETQNFVTNVMGSYGGPIQGVKASPDASKQKVRRGKKGATQEELQSEDSPDIPRRPRPKIIEVRSHKTKSQNAAGE
ncbi:MAG: lytic transglycosylase domain-containing protein [Thermodesulfobacteriota bacterium]